MSKIIVDQIEGLSSQLVTFNDGISVTGSVSISGQNALTNAIASLQNDTDNNRIVITDSLGNVSYLDLSSYLDDTNDFVTAAALDTVTGVLTLTRNSGSEITVDIGYDTLQSNIDAEESARTVADAALQANIDNEASIRGAADIALQANIDAEEAARISADNTLQSNIDTEASTRAAADIVLQNNIDAEEAARISADTTLQTNIDTEASTRAAADTVLQNNIDAEEAARIAADTTLQSNIDSEATARSNADTTLQNNITSEETDRIAADAVLQAQIDATDSNLSNYQLLSEKGQPNGYAGLDPSGLVPAAQLPSFVDDVIEVANFASLPGTGEAGKIYVTIDSGDVYRWSGSAYIQINDAVSSADQATKLATARSFALSGDVTSSPVNFDGSGNVILNASVPQGAVTQHQSALAITQSQITDLTFPTPNNATITLEGGTSMPTVIGSFTTDQATNATITINHGDTSTLNGQQGGAGERVSNITVDENGHVTAVSASPILIHTGFSNGLSTTQPPANYDASLIIDPAGLVNNFSSPDGTININYSSIGQSIELTSNVNAPIPIAGSNINIGTNTVINLNDSVDITGNYKVTNPTASAGQDVESYLDLTKLAFRRKPGDPNFPSGYYFDSLRLQNTSLNSFAKHDGWLSKQPVFEIKAGVSDYDEFGNWGDEETVLSKICFGAHESVPFGYFHGGLNFRGMRNVTTVTPGGGDFLAEPLFGWKPFGTNDGSLGGLYVNEGENSGQGPNGLLMTGGFSCADNYFGGYTTMQSPSLYDWWTATMNYDNGGLKFYANGNYLGTFGNLSDYRIKQNINQISDGAIDRVKQLKPVSFNWKTTDKYGWKNEEVTKEGFIAHEVQEVIPSGALGEKDGDTLQQLELDSIVAVLTKAVQEQQAIIETLQSEIELLKAK